MKLVNIHNKWTLNPRGTESTAFLGVLWAHCAQSAPRKAFDLGLLPPDSVFLQIHNKKRQELRRTEKHTTFTTSGQFVVSFWWENVESRYIGS